MRWRVGIADAARAVGTSAAGAREAADRVADAVEEAVRLFAYALAAGLLLLAVAVLGDD